MINNKLSWINLNATGGSGGGTGGVSDYNQLANRPIKTLTGTTQNPIKLWKLDTGLYILNGFVQHTTELASEAKSLFASVVAGIMNGSYVVSAFIPFWEGQYEYLLDSLSSANYNEHQVVMILSQDDVLTLTNENEYTPTKDYHPSTKKYVDDMIINFREELDELGVNEKNIESLIAENRRRDIAIQALLSQSSDKMVMIEEDEHIISMDYSIDDGVATINKMEGSTLVNVANQKEKIGLSYSQDEIATYSNEIVVEQNTTVNPILEGNTVVNVANQRSKVIVTKEYDTIENNNHIAVPNTVDEKIRPVVEGNTLVNLYNNASSTLSENGAVIHEKNNRLDLSLLKPNTVYTLVTLDNSFRVHKCSICTDDSMYKFALSTNPISTFTTPSEIDTTKKMRVFNYPATDSLFVEGDELKVKNMIFEGDLTANPPTGYIEGLKSTFEDKKIPEDDLLEGQTPNVNTDYHKYYSVAVKSNTIYTLVHPECALPNDLFQVYCVTKADPQQEILRYTDSRKERVLTFDTGTETDIRVYGRTENADKISLTEPLPSDWNQGLYLFEGDWTHLSPEDFEHLGQYKVEYETVSKNKFDINNVVSISYGTYLIEGNTLTITSAVTNEKNCFINYEIDNLKDGQTYIINFQGEGEKNPNEPWCQIVNENGLHYNQYNKEPLKFVAKGKMTLRFYASVGTNSTKSVKYWNIQLEEGTQATAYEPYKSSIKTVYLNSPLLEGDTIEEIDGKATHVHRYGKVVLDGSEDWLIMSSGNNNQKSYISNFTSTHDKKKVYSDKFNNFDSYGDDVEGFYLDENLIISINKSKISTEDVSGVKQWLQQNPTTIVYELATPTYETISSSDIVVDSYTNGHLDYNTIVPISSTKFVAYSKEMVYLNPNKLYTIQFNSNNIGTIDITLGGNKVEGKGVVQGLNQIEIATPSTLVNNMLIIEGDNVNISELIVTLLNGGSPTYGYFEGLQSCFEEQLVKNEDSPYYGKYRVEYRSNADIKTVYLNSPLLIGDKIEEVDGKLYHWHKMSIVVLDGSENWSFYTYGGYGININDIYMNGSSTELSNLYCNNFNIGCYDDIRNLTKDFVCSIHYTTKAVVFINKKFVNENVEGWKQWLQQNPTTLVYPLETPYYEEIEPSQILVRTSANGKLSFNSDIPLTSIQLAPYEHELTYLYNSTAYTIQFVANANCTVNVTLGGAILLNQAVTIGLNNIHITTPSTLTDNKLKLSVIGNCKISELVVTNSTEEFGYFEGMKSTFEDTVGEEGYNAEVIIYNAPIRFGKGGRL